MSYESYSARGRIAQLARGIAATVAVAALVGGIPYLLCRFVGWPLPRHVPTWHAITSALSQRDISDTTVVDVLAIALWICWAVLVLAFVVEAIALARSRSVGRVPIAGRLQPLAGVLLGTAVLTFASLVARPGGSGAGMPRAAITTPIRPPATERSALPIELTAAITNAPVTNGAATNGTVANGSGVHPAEVTYTVRDGDTLWGIAERQLGDASKWNVIFELNRGVPQLGGGALEHPHWIYPGWVLRLPATKAAPSVASKAPPASATDSPRANAPTTTPPTTVPTMVPASAAGPVAPRRSTTPDRTEPTDATTGRTGGAHRPVPGQTGDGHGAGRSEPAVAFSPTDRIGGGLVVVILGALVALRLHRRQRYRPRSPRPGRDLRTPALTPGLTELLAARREHAAANDDAVDELGLEPPPERLPLSAVPEVGVRATPDRIEVAMSDDGTVPSVVELSLGEWPGLVLAGAGAESTLRAWCAALLARGGAYNVEFVTTTRCAARLFAGLDIGSALGVVPGAEAVCARAEAAFVSRSRHLEANDVEDAAAYRLRHPEDPFPCVIALVDGMPPSLSGRWRALTDSATRFGGVTLVLDTDGPSDAGDAPQLVVDAEGCVERATPVSLAEVFAGQRCMQLGADAAADLLAPVVAVHNYVPPEDEGHPADESPVDRSTDALGNAEAVESDWPQPRTTEPDAPPETTTRTMQPADDTQGAPVRVWLLGPSRIEAFGEVVSSRLRGTAFELLAWFALRPEGATRDAAADVLFPDATAEKGRDRFWTALGNLRTRLGKPEHSTDRPLELIAKVGDRYIPDPAVLDVDLWRFEAALAEAAATSDPAAKARALEVALADYGGDFCPGIDDLWCEPAREDLHRRALDAAFRIAELTEQQGDNDGAVLAWERAIALDPIAEASYRRLATLLVERGRTEEAVEVGRRLTRKLGAVELEPSREANAFFADLRAQQRRTDERRGRPEGRR